MFRWIPDEIERAHALHRLAQFDRRFYGALPS
jgi:hypothetical protein